jgi:hypothetical protein
MKNLPKFDRPDMLVLQIMQDFPPRKRMSVKALTDRFHQRYGKNCSRWMVARGVMTLLERARASKMKPDTAR